MTTHHHTRPLGPANAIDWPRAPSLTIPILLFWLAVVPALPAQECEQILVRVGKGADSELIVVGHELLLQVGRSTDIYLQVKSRSPGQPYTTNTNLGFPSDFGSDEFPRHDISRLVTIVDQTSKDTSIGRLEIATKRSGFGAFGYRINSISRPGNIQNIDPSCRSGLIPFHAIDPDDRLDPREDDTSLDRFRAADELVLRLLAAAAGRAPGGFYPREYLDRIYEDGFGGMIVVLAEALALSEFRLSPTPASGSVPPRLLEALHGRHERPLDIDGLSAAARNCSRASSAIDCVDLAQKLISSERFKDRNSDLLRSFSKDLQVSTDK